MKFEIHNISKRFRKHGNSYALKDVSLAIPEGEIYGIIGMSGAGKSTLMRCLSGLEQPDQGSIQLDGQEIIGMKGAVLTDVRKKMGMVFQHFHLFSSRTVAENIAYPMEIFGVPKKQQKERVDELLEVVSLTAKADMYPSRLSGGEKQRVGIARALANHPSILLCDEPTSALDAKTTRSVVELLQDLNKKLGLTIVVITHQLEVVKQLCTRVAVLSHGQLVEEGEITHIFTHPQHEETCHLLYSGIDHIPKELLHGSSDTRKLVMLFFEGESAKQPVITQLIRSYAVDVNILLGSLDHIRSTIIGNLLVELSGAPNEIQRALDFLQFHKVNCEVVHE